MKALRVCAATVQRVSSFGRVQTTTTALFFGQNNVAVAFQKREFGLRRYPMTDANPTEKYRNLPGHEKNCFLTYVWIDGTGEGIRGKTRVSIGEPPQKIEDVPKWSYDGSSCYQAEGENSDLLLHPIAMCKDPFFPGLSKIILCDVYDPQGEPAKGNNRQACLEAVEKTKGHQPWFSFEQEYTLLGVDQRPFGFPEYGYPPSQGPYYCSVGAGLAIGRDIADSHMLACKYAQLDFEGTNAEVLCGQWEYQVGPCLGLHVADQLWLSRYILYRVAEEFGAGVSFDPKPVAGPWNGTGNHCNFSTEEMRQKDGIKPRDMFGIQFGNFRHIREACEKLALRHPEHIAVYDPSGGEENKRRLTGSCETASIDKFSWGEGSRTASVRIPRSCVIDQKGWLEDRRPSANCDPYQVINRLLRTTLLDE